MLQGFADFYVPKWGIEIIGCGLYMKEGRRWINFPSKEFTNPQGEKKFMPHIKFREKSHKDAFCEMAKKAIAKWCEENSSSAPKVEETPKQDSLPF